MKYQITMSVYYEYNIINTLPLLDYNSCENQLCYYPRYKIVDTNNILKCFNRMNSKINIYGKYFKYIKVKSSRYFNLVDVKTLFYYIIVENNFEFNDVNDLNIDIIESLCKSNNYVMITCPVLEQNNEYYTISNNSKKEKIVFTPNYINNDKYIINLMICRGCYSFGDNINILIALYSHKYLEKHELLNLIQVVKKNLINSYTDNIMLFLMSSYKVNYLACDFYSIFVLQNINVISMSEDILQFFDIYFLKNQSFIPFQIQNKNIFLTMSSCMYPYIPEIPKYKHLTDENVYIFDMYGILASILINETLYKKWMKDQNIILQDYKKLFGNSMSLLLINILKGLVMLNTYGYENIKINRFKLFNIWNNILSQVYSQEALNFMLLYQKIPRDMLKNIYEMNLINIHEKTILLIYDKDICDYIYKEVSYCNLIPFYNKIREQKLESVMLCINKQFLAEDKCKDKHIIGSILIDYIKEDFSRVL